MVGMPRLPFTQGIEMEVQVVDGGGRLLRGAPLLQAWKHLMENALKNLQRAAASAPSEVSGKLLGVSFKEKERRGKRLPYIVASYKTPKGSIEVDVFGPDPNVSQITWILELVTPPCESIEELEWWIRTLYSAAYASLPPGCSLISIGFNPLEEEYRSGVTFGDHYHIGGMRRQDVPAIYNMIRAFVPHMIALTANSPFIREGVTGIVKVQRRGKTTILGKDCVRDIRLKYNVSQVGPADKDHYIPYLESLDRRLFDRVVMREPPDDRYVDVFPFTDYGTIEVRVFDSQFSVARRLAVVALLQALALKAIRLSSKEVRVPNVSSSVLVENREKAILYALLGKFFPDRGLQGRAASLYNASPSGTPYTKLFEAVRGMLEYVKEEVEELGLQEYLKPFLVSVYGSKRLEPPCSPADYLLYLYDSSGGNMDSVVRSLIEITHKYCTGPGDPVLEAFGEAEVVVAETPRPAVKVSMNAETSASMVVAGEKIPFTVELEGERDVEATLIAKVVLAERDEALQAAIKNVTLKAGRLVKVTGSQLPLTIPLKAFQGVKACRLKFTLKGEGVDACEAETRTFRAVATPNVKITAEAPPKTITKGEKRELKVRVESKTPAFKGEYQVMVLAEKPGKTTPIITKRISPPGVVSVPLPSSREEQYSLRIQVSYMGEQVAEHRTPPIKVEKVVEKPAKPTMAEVPREEAAVAKAVKPAAPPTIAPRRTEAVAVKVEEAKPKVRVVTTFTPPTQAKQAELGAPQISASTPTAPKPPAMARPKAPAPRAPSAVKPPKPARPLRPPARPQVSTKDKYGITKRKKAAPAGVRVSRTVDVSRVSLKPRVSASGDVLNSIVKWGETCKAVFELRNLNPEVVGPFFVEVMVEGEEEKLLDFRELTVKQSEKLTYKVKAGKDVKGERFAFRCRILHGEAVLAECKTRSVQVSPLPVKDAVKVVGVDYPREAAASSTIVVKFKVDVKGIVKPVKLAVSAATDTVARKEYVVSEGKHVLPIAVKAWREKGKHELKLSLDAEGVKLYRKELAVQTLPQPPATASIALESKNPHAGSQIKYILKIKNNDDQQAEVKGEVSLITLQGELEAEDKINLKLKPRRETEIRGKIETPPWITGKHVYLQATLQLKTRKGIHTLTETSPPITITPPPSPLVKVTFTKTPSTVKEEQKVKLTINVKKKIPSPIQVNLTATTPTSTQKVWSGKIKQQEKTITVTWKTPRTPNPTLIHLKTEVYTEGRLLPPEVAQAPIQKIKITKNT
ncbi:MAG: hypothetical protein KIH01_05325 [Candidatus Freyarchaeota archaeon]|nr:hypothetical protein [Candidatus Jordarchaeia archaeon]